jgi:hypothetical protein
VIGMNIPKRTLVGSAALVNEAQTSRSLHGAPMAALGRERNGVRTH